MTGWKTTPPAPGSAAVETASDRAVVGPVTSVTASKLTAPLATPSRVDDIESRLVTAIALGEYLPGARLPPERELAAALGTGRETVRAALARLVERGLLRTQRGRGGGSFVEQQWPDSSSETVLHALSSRWESLRDTIEAISLLHGTIAEAAALRRTAHDVEVLQSLLAEFERADSGIGSQQVDARLHLAITAAAHNSALPEVLLQLESQVSIAAPAHIWGDDDTMREMEPRALADHTVLVDAICAGDRTGAGEIARRHALIDIEIIERALTRTRA